MKALPGAPGVVTVLAVADTDSYLKWGAATLATLPATRRVQVVLANPVAPSPAQRLAAGAGSAVVVSPYGLARLVRRLRPDAVLLACTGPVVAALLDAAWARRPDRPVLVTGLPGISIPATARALELRAGCDLFLVHSHREVAAFSALARDLGLGLEVGLARLPFLVSAREPVGAREGGHVLFAAQAKVPADRADREQVLVSLARVGDAVVKLRAAGQERQTHHEQLPYPALHADLVARGRLSAGSVRFATGAMKDALAGARALVTVSSTAALEAMAADVPVLLVDDFGVSTSMINTVFVGSGCLGSLADLERSGFGRPDPAWRRENYFHPARDDDAAARFAGLLEQRTAGRLRAPLSPRGRRRDRWRRRLRLSVPVRWLTASRLVRRLLPPGADRGTAGS